MFILKHDRFNLLRTIDIKATKALRIAKNLVEPKIVRSASFLVFVFQSK